MSIRKFAHFDLSPTGILVPRDATKKTASKIANNLSLPDNQILPGKLYITTRAISNRCNDNGDFFSANQLLGKYDGRTAHNDEYGYKTFIGKPVFLNHNNSAHDDPRGRIVHSSYHEEPWTEKTSALPRLEATEHEPTDAWIKIVHEVDADRYPLTAMALEKGLINKTSMGTDIEFAKCSICDNQARYTYEYCDHIANHRMARKFTMSDGSQRFAYDKNYGLQFFEDSLLTVDPADPTADILEVLSEKPNTLASIDSTRHNESIDEWNDKRSDLSKAAFRKSFHFPKINNNTIIRSNKVAKKRIVAGAQNKRFRLFVMSSKPDTVMLLDRKTGKSYHYGRLASPTYDNLKAEMERRSFAGYARKIMAQDSDAVMQDVEEFTDSQEPSDDAGTVDTEDTVQDHVEAKLASDDEDADDMADSDEDSKEDDEDDAKDAVESKKQANEEVDEVEDIQDSLPPADSSEASDENVDIDDETVVARRKIKSKSKTSAFELGDRIKFSVDDFENEQLTIGDYEGVVDDFYMDGSPIVTINGEGIVVGDEMDPVKVAKTKTSNEVLDKGMDEDGTLPAPQEPNATVMHDDSENAEPEESAEGTPSVEDEGLQSSAKMHAQVNRLVAKRMNKMWDALELADHQARLGEIKASDVRVVARKIYDATSHSDITSQKKVYAKMQTVGRSKKASNVMQNPVMPSVVANRKTANAQVNLDDVALASLAMGE